MELQIPTIPKGMVLIGSQCVNKHPQDLKVQYGRYFLNHFPSESSKNMIKVLSGAFHNCLEPINTFTIEGGSETALSREWFKQVFDSL